VPSALRRRNLSILIVRPILSYRFNSLADGVIETLEGMLDCAEGFDDVEVVIGITPGRLIGDNRRQRGGAPASQR